MKTQIKNLFLVPALIASLGFVLTDRATAQTFTTLHTFTGSGSDGFGPKAGLILSGNTLYGTTENGGSSGYGAVFKVKTDGSGYTTLYSFTLPSGGINSDGYAPHAGLILSGNTLYGTAQFGGSSGNGTVFKVNTDGSGFATLHSFAAPSTPPYDGAYPQAGLTLSGNTLYGTTTFGGGNIYFYGTVFKINTDGSGYATLHNFAGGSDGGNCQASLILSGNTLYGTEPLGGSSGVGSVFKVNTNGTGFTTVYSFTGGSDGVHPKAGVILSGNTLYGTAYEDFIAGHGTVFKVNTNGTGFTTLHSFTGIEGANPLGGLVLSFNTLYGTASAGDIFGYGTVFKVSTDGTGFTVLKDFSGGSDGANPLAGLTLSFGTLYGTTSEQGGGHGTVFKLDAGLAVNFVLAAKNDVVPAFPAGAKFSKFGVPACNNSGDVAFGATLATGFGGVTSANNNAIYAGSPGAENLVARSDDFAPDASGTPTVAKFMKFSDPAFNNGGWIAFRGTLKSGIGGVTTANDTGLWCNQGSIMFQVAREGDVAPDTGGATFSSFTSFALPDAGDVVFIGKLLVAGAVTTSNNTGIWYYDSTHTMRLLTRTGDSVLVNSTTKTLKTLTLLPIVPNSPGQSRSFNNDGGKLVYKAAFTDGTSAILGSSYP